MKKSNKYSSTLLVFLCGLLLTSGMFFFEKKEHQKNALKDLSKSTEDLILQFESHFQSTLLALDRVAKRWEVNKGTKRESWEKDVEAYIKDYRFFQAIEWVDKENIVRWIIPHKGNESALNYRLSDNLDRLKAIENSKKNNTSYASKVVDLKQSGKGFLIFFPLFYDNQHQGFILAVFKINELLKSLFNQTDFYYQAFDGDNLISSNKEGPTNEGYSLSKSLHLSNLTLKLLVTPHNSYLQKILEKYKYYTTIFALLFSFIFSLLFFLILSLKESLKANRELREKIQLTLDASGLGFWDFHLLTGELVWDKRMYSLYEVKEEGRPNEAYELWSSTLHPDDKESSEKELQEAINGGKPFDTKFRINCPGGKIKTIRAKAYISRDKNGQAIEIFGLNWDITKEEQINNLLKGAKELAEDSLAAKTQFITTVGHEIRTPLNAILSSTTLLDQENKTPEEKELIKTIQGSGNILLSLINDVLDFSKIEAGKMDLDMKRFHLINEVNLIAHIFSSTGKENAIAIHVHFEDVDHPWVYTDLTKYRQVIVNLVGNAMKFARSCIKISVKQKIIHDKEFLLTTSIEDDGEGIHKNDFDKLFHSFVQLQNTKEKNLNEGSTGLGLSISKGLIELLGGDIRVESTLGKGTTFSFDSIVKPGNEFVPQEEVIDKSFSQKYPLSILMVEDNKTNQFVGRKMMEKMGYTIDMANDGYEAIRKLKEKKFDFVLMDQHMPKMDGIEATKIIAKKWSQENRPYIVALTANIHDDDKKRCLEAGMNGFLSKPIKINKIAREIKKFKEKI